MVLYINNFIISFCLLVFLSVQPGISQVANGSKTKSNKTITSDLDYPAHAPAALRLLNDGKGLELLYNNTVILRADFSSKVKVTSTTDGKSALTQKINIKMVGSKSFRATITGSEEALAAETDGKAQKAFPLVRTTHGLSNNLRNNAIYDRNLDWLLQLPEGIAIRSMKKSDGNIQFEATIQSDQVEIKFYPRYYQKHKNLPYFEPWKYKIYKEPITGWSSWWAYFREFSEQEQQKLLNVWEKKHFSDYGYRFIQIDDVFQGEYDKNRENCEVANNYYGGRPTTWLDWKKDLFPGGLNHYVKSVRKAGFSPAIWMGCYFSDKQTTIEHPDWFVTDKNGKVAAAPWVSYTLDASNPEVVDALIRPVFKGLKNAGVEYVKIDQLRHYLYDCLHNNLDWCRQKGITPDQLLRAYLRVAREELGDETFILACWGVLPEAIGLADACRIGGDGFGPVTMQQYNSWNGIVWRNDPDHCDILPRKSGQGAGNITQTKEVKAISHESIIRPALASIAGAMLLLSDKPDVYENDNNLFGLRRSAPVLFSVPGQLYDFDPRKTNWIKEHQRTEIKSGRDPAPSDADQFGSVCPYWLNEFNTSLENWHVLHILNWSDKDNSKHGAMPIKFDLLGLDPSKEYLVYEFWGNKFLGKLKGQFTPEGLPPYGLQSFAIREKTGRPQIISTNRHLSQGAAEIEMMRWANNTLEGRSHAIIDDQYVLSIYVPDNYTVSSVLINDLPIELDQTGNLLKVAYMAKQTTSISWQIKFESKN